MLNKILSGIICFLLLFCIFLVYELSAVEPCFCPDKKSEVFVDYSNCIKPREKSLEECSDMLREANEVMLKQKYYWENRK